MLVFVYGSLKNGRYNHSVLGNSTHVGDAWTTSEYLLVDIGHFPGLLDGDNTVYGEIYRVDADIHKRLDRLEGQGVMYFLRPVNLYDFPTDEPVYTYFFNPKWYEPENYPEIISGVW